MSESQDGRVQVEIGVGGHEKSSAKSPAALQEAEAAPGSASATAAAGGGGAWSNACMWSLFVLGWLLPPCWWIGVAGGLRTGDTHEFLVKRRKGMTKSATIAWAASVTMTVVSSITLILVLSIYYGRPGLQQEGPYYITMVGPGDVFPNLNDPSSRFLLAQAVHSGLSLGAYPVSGISLWIDSTATLPATMPAQRRLLQADLPANQTVEVAVLGYNLEVTPELPKSDDLAARIEDGSATDGVSEQLVAVGLIKAEHVGRIALGLIGKVSRDRLTEMLERKDGNPAFDLVPAGKRCKGNWTEWTACAPCANRTRTFAIPPRTQERDAESADPQPPTSRRLHKADTPRAGNGHGNGWENNNDQDNGNLKRPGSSHQEESDTHSGSGTDYHEETYNSGSQLPGFGKRPSAQGSQSQGLAHAFGQGNGLALALGHIECAVVNNTVEVEACECPEGYCTGTPEATEFVVAFDWACVAGSLNGTLCSGDCTSPSINGTADALCNNGTYQITNNTCAIS